jgi:hypothetical protein
MEKIVMSEDSRAPPGKRKSRPRQAASFGSGSNSPIVSRFGDPAQPLAEIRERNAQITRITQGLRRIHKTGERPSVELTLELARRLDAFDSLERLVHRFSAADPKLLHAVGGDRFPPSPIRLVATTPICVAAGRIR